MVARKRKHHGKYYPNKWMRAAQGVSSVVGSALRMRNGGSMTATRTKKKMLKGKVRVGTYRGTTKYRNKKKVSWLNKMRKVFPANYSFTNVGARYQNTPGRQEYNVPGYSFDKNDLNTFYMGLIPGGSSSDKTGRSQRVLVESCHGQIIIRNQTNVQVMLTLYELKCIKSTSTDPIGLIGAGYREKFGSSISDEYGRVGASPTYSNEFNRCWKIVKSFKKTLDAGDVFTHKYYYKLGRTVDPVTFVSGLPGDSAANVVQNYQAGLTRCTMIRQHGIPVNTETGNIVTTSDAAIDVVYSEKKKYRLIEWTQNRGTSIVDIEKNPATQKAMLDAIDTVSNVIEA